MTVPAARSYLVVGGGMVGAASALRLRAAGFDVALVDPGGDERAASYGNIGCIAAEQCEPMASPRTLLTFPGLLFALGGPLDFRWRDAALWGPWSLRFVRACAPDRFALGVRSLTTLLNQALGGWERLCALAASPSLVRPCGHNVLWMDARRGERGVAAWRHSEIGATTFRELTTEELAAYGAAMKRAPARGIRFTGTGKLADPQGVRDALLADFVRRGGLIRKESVDALAPHADGVAARLASGEVLRPDAVLVSAGAWSAKLMSDLGARAPLIGERGYSVRSETHAWPADLPPTVFEERALVVNLLASGLRASSFVEFGAPEAPPDSRKWEKLERDLRELGIAFSPAPARWMGPRPTLPDYLPAIGRLSTHPRVLYAFGHQHLGITLSAVTAEIVEALASNVAPGIDLAPFRIERFV